MATSTFKRSFAGKASIAFLLLTACASAFAVSTWNNFSLSSNCTPDAPVQGSPTMGTALATCTAPSADAGTLALTGVSTGSGTTTVPSSTTNFNSALIYDWGTSNGIGVVATNESSSKAGPHALDNKNGTDALLLNFSVSTNLSSVKLGWNGTDNKILTDGVTYKDSDLSIFAWTGTASAPTLTNVGPASLASNGWTLVGNYFNVGGTTTTTTTIANTVLLNSDAATVAANIYSSYWLVSAYNSIYGGSDSNFGGRVGIDAFKVLAISANNCSGNTCPTPPGVPEPGSLALISAAFMSLVVSRRRLGKVSS